jgi:hypothetical protein
MSSRITPRLQLGSLITLTGILAWMAGCNREAPVKPTAPIALEPATFVGDSNCVKCHKEIADDHAATNHARTMRKFSPEGLGTQFPTIGVIPQSGYQVQKINGKYEWSSQDNPSHIFTMDYALGFGKTGMTYITLNSRDQLTELRMSYFPSKKTWFTTPGQEDRMDSELGRVFKGELAHKCLRCHSTTKPTDTLAPEPKFQGVGCEACHGAGSAHVEAMQRGEKTNLQITALGKLSAEELNHLCGKCHRNAEDIKKGTPEVFSTQRFQPYGLSLSKCFQKSNKSLSCITCHNSHKNVEHNTKQYETTCLSCHSEAATANTQLSRVAICKVNSKNDCIKCHMPLRGLFGDTKFPLQMADHYIRIHSTQAP